VRFIDLRQDRHTAVWLTDLGRFDGTCAANVGIVPATVAQPPVSGMLLTIPSTELCDTKIPAAIRALMKHDQILRISQAAAALARTGGSAIEIFVGPAAKWSNVDYVEVALLGLRESPVAGGNSILLTLAHPALPAELARDIASVTAAAAYTGNLTTRAGRVAFMNCFLRRSCPGPRDNVAPIAFF
jgi:hypothetical protein